MNKTITIGNTITIHGSPEAVFHAGATPRNWPIWHPTATSVGGDIGQPVTAGSRVLESDQFGPLTGTIQWVARDAMPGRGWTSEGTVRGVPFAGGTRVSINYVLSADGARTIVDRTMTYRPTSVGAWILDSVYLRRYNAAQSQRSLEALKQFVEGA